MKFACFSSALIAIAMEHRAAAVHIENQLMHESPYLPLALNH